MGEAAVWFRSLSVVPYVTGGVGGLSLFERASLGINDTETFLTGNVGGGVKWYAPNSRWGLRGDYRFLIRFRNFGTGISIVKRGGSITVAKATEADSLTLLDRMTPKLIKRYERRGIFTVTQLSCTFRPRKRACT